MAVRWRDVAERLAEQLAVHAFCDRHPAPRPDSDCPFCSDRAAYDAYLQAGGRDFRERPYAGPAVSVHDLHQRDRARHDAESADAALMPLGERERLAVNRHRCPRCGITRLNRCRAEDGSLLEHPHAERTAKVKITPEPGAEPCNGTRERSAGDA